MMSPKLEIPADHNHAINKIYHKLTPEWVEDLKNILPTSSIFLDPETLKKYGHDETEDLVYLPEIVVVPSNVKEISILMAWCCQHSIPVTPRGAGTGLSGGALPVLGGVLLSMEKLNHIISIDTRNHQAVVEAGVITQELMDEVEKIGLYYPIDPSSKGSSFIGGNVAHGSGGPRVVKYGTLRDYVLNLEVVLPDGIIIWTGANTLKFSAGLNLTQLMIGSEGTLAIITKVVLRLIPKPKTNLLLMVSFENITSACAAVSEIFIHGFIPSALELMERRGIEWVIQYEGIHFTIPENVEAYLMIELDGTSLEVLMAEAEALSLILDSLGAGEILLGDTATQKEQWWKMRRKMAESVKAHSIYKEEDTVVPRAELANLMTGIRQIEIKYGFNTICYGHAGDGNLHINILKGNLSNEIWTINLPFAIREIFELTVSLGGTLSGEHGIGWVQKDYMTIAFSQRHLELLKGIKNIFDPKHILNPGKMMN